MKRSCMGHTKLKKLARRLSVPTYAAVGLLECLWHLTAREAYRGDIGRLSDEDICVALDWAGDETQLIAALIECRWLDPSKEFRIVVHDWHEHADDATKKAIARNNTTFATETQVLSDKSGNVATSRELSRLPEPEPVPKPEPLPPKPPQGVVALFPERFHTPEFGEAITRWEVYRKERKHPPWTKSTVAAKAKAWAGLPISAVIAALDKSIENGWQGVFLDKPTKTMADKKSQILEAIRK